MDFIVEETTTPKKVNSLWVEKYRPSALDGYIGNETIKEKVVQMIENKDIPHLLFFGPAGTGKTTLAKMLVGNIPCDYIYINASTDNGIDNVRDNLKQFAMGAGFKALKVVILDEADFLSQNAQAGLRNMMEAYSAHTRFILTCNYVEKMLPAIASRCQQYEIKPISKKEVALKLVSILKEEKVEFSQEDIVFCVNTYYPDIRKVINFAQQSNINGKLKISKENAVETDALNKIVELLNTPKGSAFQDIRQIIVDIDPNALETVYRYLFDKVDTYAKGKEAMVIIELADAINASALVIPKVRDITFLACIQKILNHLKK
jgi:replication factor C small subunit